MGETVAAPSTQYFSSWPTANCQVVVVRLFQLLPMRMLELYWKKKLFTLFNYPLLLHVNCRNH